MAWCLMLADLRISDLDIDATAFSTYHDWLPSTITHLVVAGNEWQSAVCASNFGQFTRLTSGRSQA